MNLWPKHFWQTFIGFSMALAVLSIYQTEQQTQALLKIQSRYKWVVVMAVFALNVAAGAYLLGRFEKLGLFRFMEREWTASGAAGIAGKAAGLILFLGGFALVWFARLEFFGKALTALFPIFWVVWWTSLLQAGGLKLVTRASWPVCFALALLAQGIVFQSYAVVQVVTDYPFSITWSEASRYYYASLLFSKLIYGRQLPLSIWHPTRYFLLSLPFLLQDLPLWAHRLWQALLWLGLTGLTSWLIVRRMHLRGWASGLILGGWFFLYLFQGAVYYHLQICVILILLGVSPGHPWRSAAAVVLASLWAGMSRLNWYPVPAMLAVTLYVLEQPPGAAISSWQYLRRPALWGLLGLMAALAGQALYIFVSGNQNLQAFGSSLSSALLWYRLLPNPTNPLGILPGIALVSLPMILILWRLPRRAMHGPGRWLLAAILLVLLAGGAVVSTKIGGGGDLHNMDAFMILLAVIAAYRMCRREAEGTEEPAFAGVAWAWMVFLLMVPVGFSLTRFAPPIRYDREEAARELALLQQATGSAASSGEVLFIYERHLLTFGEVRDVPLVPDYEVIALQEMVISGNRPYLEAFYADLRNHRFTAIVAHRQSLDAIGADFAEESALWNQLVLYPLLCEYEPRLSLEISNVWVLYPRAARECPASQSNSVLP